MNEVCRIAKKWCSLIPFSKEFDLEFERILKVNSGLTPMRIEEYHVEECEQNIEKNLVMILYFCERASEKYTEMGIPQEIFLDTVKDFAISAERCRSMYGRFGFYRISGLLPYLNLRIFRIGRLVFKMGGAYKDIDEKGIKKGENIIDVHVPGGEPLVIEDCFKSLAEAERFFDKYFPDYSFEYFTCFSWLLDSTLRGFLNENSNILKFQELFEVVHQRKEDSILHFMFKYGIKDRVELNSIEAKTDFAKKIKEYALSGGDFYNVLGVRRKDNYEH